MIVFYPEAPDRPVMLAPEDVALVVHILMGIDTYEDDDPVVELKRKLYPHCGLAWLVDDDEPEGTSPPD